MNNDSFCVGSVWGTQFACSSEAITCDFIKNFVFHSPDITSYVNYSNLEKQHMYEDLYRVLSVDWQFKLGSLAKSKRKKAEAKIKLFLEEAQELKKEFYALSILSPYQLVDFCDEISVDDAWLDNVVLDAISDFSVLKNTKIVFLNVNSGQEEIIQNINLYIKGIVEQKVQILLEWCKAKSYIQLQETKQLAQKVQDLACQFEQVFTEEEIVEENEDLYVEI